MGGRSRVAQAGRWLSRFKRVPWPDRQIRRARRETRARASTEAKWVTPDFQEKPLSIRSAATVPETNTGGQGEHPKACERTRVKELGKMAP